MPASLICAKNVSRLPKYVGYCVFYSWRSAGWVNDYRVRQLSGIYLVKLSAWGVKKMRPQIATILEDRETCICLHLLQVLR